MQDDPGLLRGNSSAGTSHWKRLQQILWSRCPHHHLLSLWEAEHLQSVWAHAVMLSHRLLFSAEGLQDQAHGLLPSQDNQICHITLHFVNEFLVVTASVKLLRLCYVVPCSDS